MSADYDAVKSCARDIKGINPSIKILIGGIHATLCADTVARDKEFDYVVIGEGEKALANIAEGAPYGKIVTGEIIDNLDDIPFIERHIFGSQEYPLYPSLFP